MGERDTEIQRETRPRDAAKLLARVNAGDSSAADELRSVVHEQLRGLASSYSRGQPANHALQATALAEPHFCRNACL